MPRVSTHLRAALMSGAGLAAVATLATVPAAASPATSQSGCPLPAFGAGADYHPTIAPANFSPHVTNPWFPLTPGRVNVYAGVKNGKPALNIFAPTSRTKVIDGVSTRVVEDRLYLDNRLEERTADYYAQDRCGNVWYFGENTATLDGNLRVISSSGSFHAGRSGAQPGVYMPAQPQTNERFRQEWYQGQAEDTFRPIDLSTSATVPFGRFTGALRTEETTALEPDVVDNKLFARNIGQLIETAVKGPKEKLSLVEVINLGR